MTFSSIYSSHPFLTTPTSVLQVKSGSIQNVPSLEIQSNSLQAPPMAVTSTTTLSTMSSSLQIKTEGVATPPSSTASGLQRIAMPIVTGTGSVTATPTAYTTAVTTLATSTITGTGAGQETVLGKRIRRTSTKYDDYEQPPLAVSQIIIIFHLSHVILLACS